MKKITTILLSVLIVCPLFAQEIKDFEVEYKIPEYAEGFQGEEYRSAIQKGINYWKDCLPVGFNLKDANQMVTQLNVENKSSDLVANKEMLADQNIKSTEKTNVEKNKFTITWDNSVPLYLWGEANYLKTRENNEIVGFLIKINANRKISPENLEVIIAHEMGHIIGIEHTTEDDSDMHYNGKKITEEKKRDKDISECKRSDLNKIKF